MGKEIVKACIKYKNKLFTGFDHGECFDNLLKEEQPKDMTELEQGFIDNELNFVDRKSAMVIANIAGQLKFKPVKETLISEDLHLDWLNRQAKQIADLKYKLAEYQNDGVGDVIINSGKKIKELQQQLAESERNNLILYSMLYETLEKQGSEDIASKIDQMTGLMLEKQADWFKGNRNYDQLKQQLVEKVEFGKFKSAEELLKAYQNLEREFTKSRQKLAEKDQAIEGLREINQSLGQTCNNDAKEIDRLNKLLAEEKNRNKKLNHEAQKYYEDAYYNDFQNQKAIAVLEEMLDNEVYINSKLDFEDGNYVLSKIIRTKIEELRNGRN